jgi:hypothetical protein
MKLSAIFEKPVDRPIEGVIKADDEASLRLELEEYVLTNEVEKRLEAFLDAYNSYSGANGVWVSGFFGSGKSHLLKMLALLLEDRQIEGKAALEWFLPKCGDNEFLRGELKRAVSIPSKSILFNIDQKADVISKAEFDALLSVFVKVFNEMRGYYGKQGHIARFERDLDSRSLYEDFKAEYEAVAGRPWTAGREQALLESQNIAKAYAKVTGDPESSAVGILDKYRQDYRVSIEDFAEEVKAYIDRQSPQFRLNFFVDEVGQYIAEHVKLMTNLQTIAESLATKCQGRAWAIVTAQEDMNTVIGEMGNRQSNDFTKIQARFANRMKLTSQDVAEVIQKRLLLKKEDGAERLSEVYQAQFNNFKTLLDFADGSLTYRNFQDQEHFINCYPFIPYQFALFQSAIQKLSQHNAFEGKHSSVGERSMLGVFQEVAIAIGNHEVGQLATFDLMFEGIRSTLKSNIQSAIILSEGHLDNPFAVRILKTLFLVKYVKEFKATVRNLCVLMLEGFEQDLGQLRKRVQEALNLLEQQTYIQRNGELYEYLTDEEKDVEQEIKNTEVETSAVADELEKVIFDQVVKNRKIRYTNGQDYPYSRKLDDRLHGREYELAINVVTPFNENAGNESLLQMQNMGRDELLVIMPVDDRLVRDLLMYKRTEKYIQQNFSHTQQDVVKRILSDKRLQNQERHGELQERVKRLFGKAKLFISGTEIEIGGEDAQNRITSGFHELIAKAYPNLRMLRGIAYTEDDIGKCLKHSEEGLFGGDVTTLAESEQEMLAAIQTNNQVGVRTTLKALVEKFERKPYGWYYAAILCTLAKLCARGKVEVRVDSNLLEDDDLERALRNSHNHGNVVLDPQVEFTASQVRGLKEFYADFFDQPAGVGEAKALGKETGVAFQKLKEELAPLAAQVGQYPFLSALAPVLETLRELCGKPYTWYLTELQSQEDDLLDLKEQVIDPVRRFMKGSQKVIYDDAREFMAAQALNFAYITSEEPAAIRATLTDPQCFNGDRIQALKVKVEALQTAIATRLQHEIQTAKVMVQNRQELLSNTADFSSLTETQQQELRQAFTTCMEQIERQTAIDVVQNRARQFEDEEYGQLLAKLSAWANPPSPPPDRPGTYRIDQPTTTTGSAVVAEPQTKYVAYKSVQVTFSKAWLADEADVDDYLTAMRAALLAEIQNGKRIQI